MRKSWLAAGLLVAVGVGAVGLVVLQPKLGGSASTEYITSTATVTDVVQSAVATGSVSSTSTYGLAFGAEAQRITSTSSNAASASSSSSNASSGGGTGNASDWEVTAVNVKVGDQVKAGDLLASAESASVTAQLAVAQANLATAQARLDEDQAGATANEKAQASSQIKQAQQQVAQAKQNQTFTQQENALSLKQAQAAVDKTAKQLATDKAADAPATVIEQDKAALQSARDQLASTRIKVSQSNAQAADSVTSSLLSLSNAKTSYATATAPASDAQLASDQAAVLTAQVALRDAQAVADAADLRAPVDGTVISVEMEAGVTAPSGYAIEVQGTSMEVVASFAEADMPSLKVGQAATVTLTATDETAEGTVSRIVPVGSSSATGGVTSYEVAVALATVPSGTLSGMSAEVDVTTAEAQDVVAVPAIALDGTSGDYAVMVVDSSTGQATSRAVEVGLTTSSLAEIRSGLQAGEAVVVGTRSEQQTTTNNDGGIAIPGAGGAFPGQGPGFRP